MSGGALPPGARRNNVVSAALRTVVAGVAILVIVGLWAAGGSRELLTFTLQSNAMVAVSFLWTAHALVWRRRTPPEWLSGSSVFYLTITGIVANTVLRSTHAGSPDVLAGLSQWDLEHVVTPCAALSVWIVFDEHRRIPWRFVWIWLMYLVAYLALVLALVASVDTIAAPYPFLDASTLGAAGVAWRIALYLAGFAALSAAMIGLDRALPARTRFSEFDPLDQG